jgi:hypothetical protein
MGALRSIWRAFDLAFDLALCAVFSAIGCAGLFVVGLLVTRPLPPPWSGEEQYLAAGMLLVALPFAVLGLLGLRTCLRGIFRN